MENGQTLIGQTRIKEVKIEDSDLKVTLCRTRFNLPGRNSKDIDDTGDMEELTFTIPYPRPENIKSLYLTRDMEIAVTLR